MKAYASNTRLIVFGTVAVASALLLGFFSAQVAAHRIIWMAAAVAVFVLSFLNIEFGLYVLIFSMLLSPEIVVGQTAGSSLGRGVTLRVEDFLLILIGFSWFAKTAVNKELGLVMRTPLNRPIFLYLIACLVATAVGIIAGRVDPKTGFFYALKYFEYFVVFFVTVNHIRDTEQVKRFVFCLLLTGFIVSVIGIMQIPTGERVTAPFEGESGEPNTFGGYLVFMAAIAGGLLSEARLTRNRHLLILFLATLIPPFLFAQSRSSYLAVVPMLLVLGYLLQKRVIVIGVMLLGLLVTPLFLPQAVKDRILFTFTQQQQEGQIQVGTMRLDTSTSARLNSWQQALKDWTRHPVLGYGITGYHFVDAQIPRVLVETGILGLLAFVGLLYVLAKTALKSLQAVQTPLFRGLTVGFIAGYAGLLVHAIGANTFIIVRIMEPFWFFAGIVAALPQLENSDAQKQISF